MHIQPVLIYLQPELRSTLEFIQKAGSEAHGLTADITNPSDIHKIFEAVDQKLGRVDILVNNASLAANRLEDYTYEEWSYILQTNLIGYMACFQEGLKRMQNLGEGHIVNIGSMSADIREKGASLYVTAKSAIQGFSEAVRKEVNERNIKVTIIEPGATGTDMNKDPSYSQEEEFKAMRMLKPEDIAECVLFCLTLPQRVDVVTMQVRPHLQII